MSQSRFLMGKTVVVTGAARGIGRAIAERLGREGASVAVNYLESTDNPEEVVAMIKASGGQAFAPQGSIREVSDIRRVFAQTMEHFGRLDILVNNAGVAQTRSLDGFDEAHFADLFDVNVRGTLLACQEAARHFGPEGGRIINISSISAGLAYPGACVYAASKAAIESLTRSLAAELGPRHITVNAVAPGLTETKMIEDIPEERRETALRTIALGRLGRPEDIAGVVALLASEDAGWITGQIIHADGGQRT